MHEREIGPKWLFQEVFLVVDDNLAFVALDDRANSCCCENSSETATSGANSFDECSLRHQLDDHPARHHLLLCLAVEANVTHHGLAYSIRAYEFANSNSGLRRIVCNYGQVLFLLVHKLIDDKLWTADAHKSPNHQGGSVWDHFDGLFEFYGAHLRSAVGIRATVRPIRRLRASLRRG